MRQRHFALLLAGQVAFSSSSMVPLPVAAAGYMLFITFDTLPFRFCHFRFAIRIAPAPAIFFAFAFSIVDYYYFRQHNADFADY